MVTKAKQEPIQSTASLDIFDSPEAEGEFSKLPGCQLLNDKSSAGLFLKEENQMLSGWKNIPTQLAEDYNHTYNDGSSTKGILFRSPRMHIISRSPRLVELTMKGEEAGLGKRGSIKANYETPEGFDMYGLLGDRATLRTFYLLYLVNEKNENLHHIPLTLSVHGIAATEFGRAVEQFFNEFQVAFAETKGTAVRAFNEVYRSIIVFQPTFTASLEPKDAPKKSWCCVVRGNYLKPTPETIGGLVAAEKLEIFKSLIRSNNNFAGRYIQQVNAEGNYHQLEPGVNVNQAIDRLTGEVYQLPAVDIEALSVS